jgi:hypothetical protein
LVVVSGDNKWRIVTQRVWHGDREWPLNDRQIPNSRGVRVRVSKGTWVTPDGERTYEQRLHFVVPPPKQQQLRNQVQRVAHLGHIRRWVHQLQHLPAKHPPPVSGGHPRNQTLTLSSSREQSLLCGTPCDAEEHARGFAPSVPLLHIQGRVHMRPLARTPWLFPGEALRAWPCSHWGCVTLAQATSRLPRQVV